MADMIVLYLHFWQVYAVDVNPEDIAKADAIVIPTGDKLFKY